MKIKFEFEWKSERERGRFEGIAICLGYALVAFVVLNIDNWVRWWTR